MSSFWHFDAGNLAVLFALLGIYSRISVMSWQHKKMWADYEKRHGMNGYTKAQSSAL